MTMNKPRFRQLSSAILVSIFLLGILGFLVVNVQKENWAGGSRLFCLFYVGVVTVFFLAQIVAFVVSHANYSDSVEEPKFKMLLSEMLEWEGVNGKIS